MPVLYVRLDVLEQSIVNQRFKAALSSCSRHAGGRRRTRDHHGRAFRPRQTSRRGSECRRLRDDVPSPPAPAHQGAIVGCRERLAARPKLIADRTKHRTETRGVPQALEPLQTSLTLAHGTIRSPFKSLRKKRVAARALRRRCTKMSSTSPASSTARHSQPRSPLIIRQSSSKCQMFEHAPRAPQSSGVLRPEPQRPEADGLVRDLNSSGQHQFGHVAQAHAEAVVKPHARPAGLEPATPGLEEQWRNSEAPVFSATWGATHASYPRERR